MQIIDFVPLILLGPFVILCIIGPFLGVGVEQHGNTDKRPCEKHNNAKPYNENKEVA